MLATALIIPFPALAIGQTAQPTAEPAVTLSPLPRAITPQERREWVAEGILAPGSFGTSLMIATWQTAIRWPEEWPGSSGFTKSIEASLGMLWGEDPRSSRSGRHAFGSRLGYAMKTVVLTQRPDGHLAPAWGRFAGTVGSNLVQNVWLPPSLTTPKETAVRVATGLLGRLGTNLWGEFGPDLRRRFPRARLGRPTASRRPAPASVPSTQLELSLLLVAAPEF